MRDLLYEKLENSTEIGWGCTSVGRVLTYQAWSYQSDCKHQINWAWWHMTVIPALGRSPLATVWVWGQPGLWHPVAKQTIYREWEIFCTLRRNACFGSNGNIFSRDFSMDCTGETPWALSLQIRNQSQGLQSDCVFESALKGGCENLGSEPLLKMPFPPRSWGQVWQHLISMNLYDEWHLDGSGEVDTTTQPMLGLGAGWSGWAVHLWGCTGEADFLPFTEAYREPWIYVFVHPIYYFICLFMYLLIYHFFR